MQTSNNDGATEPAPSRWIDSARFTAECSSLETYNKKLFVTPYTLTILSMEQYITSNNSACMHPSSTYQTIFTTFYNPITKWNLLKGKGTVIWNLFFMFSDQTLKVFLCFMFRNSHNCQINSISLKEKYIIITVQLILTKFQKTICLSNLVFPLLKKKKISSIP